MTLSELYLLVNELKGQDFALYETFKEIWESTHVRHRRYVTLGDLIDRRIRLIHKIDADKSEADTVLKVLDFINSMSSAKDLWIQVMSYD